MVKDSTGAFMYYRASQMAAVSLLAAMNSQNDRNLKAKMLLTSSKITTMTFDSLFHEKTIDIAVEEETDSDHS